MVLPQIHPPGPVNGTLLGHRVFADVVKTKPSCLALILIRLMSLQGETILDAGEEAVW